MIGAVLGWVMGPVGRYVALAAVVVAWTAFNRMDAARQARAECNETHLQAQVEAQRQRAEEADRLADSARARADATAAEMAELERTKNVLLDELAGETGCDLPDALRERLRALGGGDP